MCGSVRIRRAISRSRHAMPEAESSIATIRRIARRVTNRRFRHLFEMSEVLPAIRERAERDLRAPALSRRQILATAVQLLDMTLIRVGSDEYAKENRSFGLTTLRDRHVQVDGANLQFSFRRERAAFSARCRLRIAGSPRIVQRCRDLPGPGVVPVTWMDRGFRKQLRQTT